MIDANLVMCNVILLFKWQRTQRYIICYLTIPQFLTELNCGFSPVNHRSTYKIEMFHIES